MSQAQQHWSRSFRSLLGTGFGWGRLMGVALLLGAVTQGPQVPQAWAGTLAPKVAAPAGAFPFAEYDALLKKYTDAEGRVDYAALKAGDAAAVERLYAYLAATGPTLTPALYGSKDAALAYYLSAYNVLVWKNVIDSLPGLKQVDQGLYKFFRSPDFKVDGKEVDLNTLEKKVILKTFRDGRIHFALNCASGGCPRLPQEAFTPEGLQAQLTREAKLFCSEARNVSYDAAKKTLRLSMIFKWYRDDFGGSEAAVLAFINKHRAADQQLPVGPKPDALPDIKIEYIDYDWRLNDKSLKR